MKSDTRPLNDEAATAFCDHPYESETVECKEWMDLNDAENLAKVTVAVIAMANSGGGTIVVGIKDLDSHFEVDGWRGDRINPDHLRARILSRLNARVEIHFTYFRIEEGVNSDKTVLFMSVSSDSKVPIMSKSTCGNLKEHVPYIRTPKPESCRPTTYEDWDRIFNTCMSHRMSDVADLVRSAIPHMGYGNNPPADAWEFHHMVAEEGGSLYKEGTLLNGGGLLQSHFRLYPTAMPSISEITTEISKRMGNSGWPTYRLPYSADDKRLFNDGNSLSYLNDRDFWNVSRELEFSQSRVLADWNFNSDNYEILGPRLMVQVYDLIEFYSYMAYSFPQARSPSAINMRLYGTSKGKVVLDMNDHITSPGSTFASSIYFSASTFSSNDASSKALVVRNCLDNVFSSFTIQNPSIRQYVEMINEAQLWRKSQGGVLVR